MVCYNINLLEINPLSPPKQTIIQVQHIQNAALVITRNSESEPIGLQLVIQLIFKLLLPVHRSVIALGQKYKLEMPET